MSELIEGEDFYWEGPYLVFTSQYHLRKGQCCGSGCRHCPYEPRGMKGTTTPAPEFCLLKPKKIQLLAHRVDKEDAKNE